MRSHALVLVTALAATAVISACGSDKPTGPTVTTFNAALASTNERNNDGTPKTINSTATGTAVFTLTGNTMNFTITVANLTGAATASHIHVGGANQNGAVVVPFAITTGVSSGTLVTGSFDITTNPASGTGLGTATISGDSLMKLINTGNAYVNVHTAANPGGEMRGQLLHQ
jgi:Cu/Zn superoxide dismutase